VSDKETEDSNVLFPHITVQLSGEDGNAFFILGRVRKALKRGGATPEEVKVFTDRATSGDYNHLLAVCMETVNVE